MNRTRAGKASLGKARKQQKMNRNVRNFQQLLIDDYLEEQDITHEVPVVIRTGENHQMDLETQKTPVNVESAVQPVRNETASLTKTEFRPIDIPSVPRERFTFSGLMRGFLFGAIPGALLLLLLAYLF